MQDRFPKNKEFAEFMTMGVWKKNGSPDPPVEGETQHSENKTPVQVTVKKTISATSLLDNKEVNEDEDDTADEAEEDTTEEADEDRGSLFSDGGEDDQGFEAELTAAFEEEQTAEEQDVEMKDVEEEDDDEEDEEEDEEEYERKEDERRRLAEQADLQRLLEEVQASAEASASRYPEGWFNPEDYASSDIDENPLPMDIEEEERSNEILPGSAEEARWDAEMLGITNSEPHQSQQEPIATVELSDAESSELFSSQTSITTAGTDSQSSTPSKKRKRNARSTTTGNEFQSSAPSKKRKSNTGSKENVSLKDIAIQFDADPLKRGKTSLVFDYDNTCDPRTARARFNTQLRIQKRDAEAKYDELMAKLAAVEEERDELKQQVDGHFMAKENVSLKEQLGAMKMARDEEERKGIDAISRQLMAESEAARVTEERSQLIKERDEAYQNRDAWMKSYEKQKALKEKLKKAITANEKKQKQQAQQQRPQQQQQPQFMQQTQYISQPLGIMAHQQFNPISMPMQMQMPVQQAQQQMPMPMQMPAVQQPQQQQMSMAMPKLTPEQQQQIDYAAKFTSEQQQDLDYLLDGIDLGVIPEDFFLQPQAFDQDLFEAAFVTSNNKS